MADTKNKKPVEVKEKKVEEIKKEEKEDIKETTIELEEEYIPDELDLAIAAEKEIFDLKEDINIQIQKLEILVEEYEFNLAEKNIETMPEEEYLEKKKIIKELYKERNALKKKTKTKTAWDQVSTWIVLYGIFQIFISLPFIPYDVISVWLVERIILPAIDSPMIIFVLVCTYAFPFLNIILSWVLYVNVVKKKLDKKVFLIIFLIQIALVLFSGIYIYFKWLKDLLAWL